MSRAKKQSEAARTKRDSFGERLIESRRASPQGTYARIYAVVKKIPRGKVATYGQIAALAGIPRHARQVGYAMHALTEGAKVPWQRVINAKGEISPRTWSENHLLQRILLEDEGVEFNAQGRVSLTRFGWKPAPAKSKSREGTR